jgi:hypothetical protein
MRFFRAFAWLYLAVATIAILWFVGVQIANRPGEHMMPLFLVGLIGAPTFIASNLLIQFSITVLPEPVSMSWWFQAPLFCAAPLLQAWFLFWLSRDKVRR